MRNFDYKGKTPRSDGQQGKVRKSGVNGKIQTPRTEKFTGAKSTFRNAQQSSPGNKSNSLNKSLNPREPEMPERTPPTPRTLRREQYYAEKSAMPMLPMLNHPMILPNYW